jgi:hypothetical protein
VVVLADDIPATLRLPNCSPDFRIGESPGAWKSAAVPTKFEWEIVVRFLVFLLTLAVSTRAASAADLETRRNALNQLLNQRWEYTMRRSPMYASTLGDRRYNDKLDDFSQKAIDDDLLQTRRFLERFEAIDTINFPEQEKLNRGLVVRDLQMDLERARFKPWEMPVNQENGIHLDAPQLVSILSFENVKDYEDYINRLRLLPLLFDQTIAQMRKGSADGLIPPKLLLEKVAAQAGRIASTTAEQSPFSHPFDNFPNAIPGATRNRLREAGLAAVKDYVLPAYVKFAAFVKDDYARRVELSLERGHRRTAPHGMRSCVPRKRKHDNKSFAGRDSPDRLEPGERDRRPHSLGGSPTRIQGHGRFQSRRRYGSEVTRAFAGANS